MLNSGVEEEFVDLGLSVLWTKGNICKDSDGNYYVGEPTDEGCYFSWGNVIGHNSGENYIFSSYNYQQTPGHDLSTDINQRKSTYNAAMACLGDEYNMPTRGDFNELINNCTATWVTSYNGVSVAGRVFKSKIAGYTDKEIFIPASGYYENTSLKDKGSYGYYWTTAYYSNDYAFGLIFANSYINTVRTYRYCGMPVRAIIKK